MKRRHWIILDRLVPVILEHVEGCIVDIGIGVSTETLYDYSRQFNREHYSCDISKRMYNWVRKSFTGIKPFCGKSIDFMKTFPDIPVAVAFIDGEHHYPTITEEVNFFLPKLSLGGVMFIHDTLPTKWRHVYGYISEKPGRTFGRYMEVTGDSYLIRQELERREDLMTFTWPYTAANYGLTMVMKKDMNAPKFRR